MWSSNRQNFYVAQLYQESIFGLPAVFGVLQYVNYCYNNRYIQVRSVSETMIFLITELTLKIITIICYYHYYIIIIIIILSELPTATLFPSLYYLRLLNSTHWEQPSAISLQSPLHMISITFQIRLHSHLVPLLYRLSNSRSAPLLTFSC